MTDVLAVLVVVAALTAVMAGLAWLGARVRRGGSRGGEFVGPFEEIWHPAAHRARAETQMVEERSFPIPPADDKPGR